MLQVRNLDLPSSHHSQDRSDTIDLLEGWSGGAKMSFILRRRGVQLILAHKLVKPCCSCIILLLLLLFLLFLHFHSCSSFFPAPLFNLFYYLFYLFYPFL